MRLNLHLLRVFFTVAELRSFSRAAEALFISQPAVSKAVRELECQIGLPLLERGAGGPKSARGVQLTPDGAAVFEHARGIFALERAAIEDVQARVGLQRGRLRVGASTMCMLRPSSRGACSTTPSAETSSASCLSRLTPSSGRDCSRPRNMMVIFTLSPPLRKRTT